MSEAELKTDTKYLKGHCLARLPMSESDVAKLFSRARRSGATTYAELAMSHERLRAELTGLETIMEHMNRKASHGCTDAHCSMCDGPR